MSFGACQQSTGRLRRIVASEATWLAVWALGSIAGLLTGSTLLAAIPFAIAAPIFAFLTLAKPCREEANRDGGPEEPIDPARIAALAHSIHREIRCREAWTGDNDSSGHTIH